MSVVWIVPADLHLTATEVDYASFWYLSVFVLCNVFSGRKPSSGSARKQRAFV